MTIRSFRVVALLVCVGPIVACAGEVQQTARAHDARASEVASAAHAAEMRACAGIPELERQAGPFAHARVTRVSPLYDHLTRLKQSWTALRGSTIELQVGPSVTKQWIMRLAQCQIADFADHGVTDRSSPLGLGPVQVTVEESTTGFIMSIRAQQFDKLLAERVLETSRALQPHSDAI